MNILAIIPFLESVKKFNTGCKETLHFAPGHFDGSVPDRHVSDLP